MNRIDGHIKDRDPPPISARPHQQSFLSQTLLSIFENSNIQHYLIAKTMSSPAVICSGISHVGLSVSDLKASVVFFKALGFKEAGGVESYPSVFVTNGSIFLTLWKTEEGNTVPFNRRTNVGLHHLALQVPSEEALINAYETVLEVKGVSSDFPPEPFGFGKHAMVFEPSGNRIELSYHSE
jgi:catechol 2,3-dioxygenase-like lactoylglutathione lyase family enzyme